MKTRRLLLYREMCLQVSVKSYALPNLHGSILIMVAKKDLFPAQNFLVSAAVSWDC